MVLVIFIICVVPSTHISCVVFKLSCSYYSGICGFYLVVFILGCGVGCVHLAVFIWAVG